MLSITNLFLAILLCAGLYRLILKRLNRVPPLPSPPGDPILGHLRYMPDTNSRDTVFLEWGRKYGEYICNQVRANYAQRSNVHR